MVCWRSNFSQNDFSKNTPCYEYLKNLSIMLFPKTAWNQVDYFWSKINFDHKVPVNDAVVESALGSVSVFLIRVTKLPEWSRKNGLSYFELTLLLSFETSVLKEGFVSYYLTCSRKASPESINCMIFPFPSLSCQHSSVSWVIPSGLLPSPWRSYCIYGRGGLELGVCPFLYSPVYDYLQPQTAAVWPTRKGIMAAARYQASIWAVIDNVLCPSVLLSSPSEMR